jgi:streptomycin 6-kinase
MANSRTPTGVDAIARYLARWSLAADGRSLRTRTSWLQPVTCDGGHAMLKVPFAAEERAGMAVLAWYGGIGAARVLRTDSGAVLMERLADDVSLAAIAEHDDARATEILCAVIAELHRARALAPPRLTPMRQRFRALAAAAARPGANRPLFHAAWEVAERLIDAPATATVLHGDVHHANVLHDPRHGWVAIGSQGCPRQSRAG